MDELNSILHAWRAAHGSLANASLATVVHVQGSAYRRPGARMLILPDGRRLGTISGGCLEGEVVRKAAWWTGPAGVALRTFDTSAQDAAWDFGLGCNGVITVLIERADDPRVQEMLAVLDAWTRQDRPGAIATVVRSTGAISVGDRLIADSTGLVGGALRGSTLATELLPHLNKALADQASCLLRLPDSDLFLEWVPAPRRVLILGAGHDAIPLAAFCQMLGWKVTIADGRPAYARPERFPNAARVTPIPSSGDLSSLPIDRETAVVMMTHNYPQDVILLPQVLARSPKYLGILGPRRRAEQLFDEVGANLADADVHAPIGLDIGSDHPETIALSIAAEIQSAFAGRSGASLRWRHGPIHAPAREAGNSENDNHPALGRSAPAACENLQALQYA